MVIGNPPFSLAAEHVAAAYQTLTPGSHIAFLLKMDFKSGAKRAAEFWPQFPYKFEIPVVGRASFKTTELASNDTHELSVFLWEVGWTGPSVTQWPHIYWKERRERKASSLPSP